MANTKLLDIMNGKITDTNQIAEVLANASSAEFVDVLNHLDSKVIIDLMHKLPEDKRSLISDFGKVRNMGAKIHSKNEAWNVSAEEYVKNSENLDKWKVDLKSKDFAQAREVVDWMNVSDEAKQLLMDTAVMKVKEESRNVKNLTEKQYKEAINFEIQLAVYQATVATSAVKQDKNPKVATQEAVNQFVEATRKQVESLKKENKPTTNFLDVSVDSILAYSASTNEWIGNRLAQAKQHFAKTKFGAEVAKITDAANKKLAVWDKKLCEHKTWGKTYKFMKKYAPVLGKVSRSVAVNMGMITLAGMTGPAGAALYAAYAVKTSCKPLVDEYKKEKQTNQSLNFCKFAADNKISFMKAAFSTANMVVSGLVGYGALGGNVLTTRLGITAASIGLNASANYHQDVKSVAKAKAAGETPKKEASFTRSLGKAALLGVGSFVAGMLGRSWFGSSNSETELETRTPLKNGGLEMPNEAKARMLDMQTPGAGTDSIKADSTLVDKTIETAPNNGTEQLAKTVSDADLKSALELVDNSCCEEQPVASKVVNANDCEAKIAAQVNASETDVDKQFWGDRANKFVKSCDQNAIIALFKIGVFKLDEMPGIGSEIEFTYKFGLMREMNLPHQRGIVEMIEEKIKAIQEVGCNESLNEQQKHEALSKITSYGKVGGETIANGMNSYDNRGNYLCEDLKSVVKPAPQPVKVEPEVEPVPIEVKVLQEPVQVPAEQDVPADPVVEVPETKTISIMDVTKGKDYRNADVYILNGQMTNDTLEEIKFLKREFRELPFENGDQIVYNFKGDDLVVSMSTLTMDETTRYIAEKVDGLVVEQYNGEMTDATNAALSVQTRLEIYNDLLDRDELKGQKAKWGERFMAELESRGLSYDAEQRSLAPIEGFDREAAAAQAQAEAETIKSVKNGEVDTKGKNKDSRGFFSRGRDDVYR